MQSESLFCTVSGFDEFNSVQKKGPEVTECVILKTNNRNPIYFNKAVTTGGDFMTYQVTECNKIFPKDNVALDAWLGDNECLDDLENCPGECHVSNINREDRRRRG